MKNKNEEMVKDIKDLKWFNPELANSIISKGGIPLIQKTNYKKVVLSTHGNPKG